VGTFGPVFGGLAAAAPAEAAAIAGRHDLRITVIPNAVPLPPGPAAPLPPGPAAPLPPGPAGPAREVAGGPSRGASLLFVGNLTYWPNADAAIRLVRDVLPRVRLLVPGPVTVTLAGNHGTQPHLLALGREPGVRLTGFVPDLGPYYLAADVLVAPLMFGAGTRIKLLEAFARGVPVVTSSQGVAGLEVTDGEHVLIADSARQAAAAVARLRTDGRLAADLGANAFALVRDRYSHDAVVPRISEFLRAAAGAGRPGTALEGGVLHI
jgi:glycosyltransferase involved in cell wall biosynthesis